uniref:Uncharacterized protein n=1 Tax=Cacopsylla melanoneura TaxID=428564 RepID=A0A8D9F6N5_9HEMI
MPRQLTGQRSEGGRGGEDRSSYRRGPPGVDKKADVEPDPPRLKPILRLSLIPPPLLLPSLPLPQSPSQLNVSLILSLPLLLRLPPLSTVSLPIRVIERLAHSHHSD